MADLVDCPICQQRTFDSGAGVCGNCGVKGGVVDHVDDVYHVDATVLAGLLHNVRICLSRLAVHEFQQILGLLSPRPGKGDDDAVPFTDATCRMTQRYLIANGVLCTRIEITADGKIERSLVVAQNGLGITRCIRQAIKVAHRLRATVVTYDAA